MGTQVGDYYKDAKFYYERASFGIIYINNGVEDNKTAYKYEADISGAGNAYKPTIPPAGKEDYVFDTWYADTTGQTEYKFDGKTMPAQNITVYAKWVPPTYTVTFYDHDGNQVYALTIAKGAKFDESQVPVITLDEGETFLGWSLKDGTPFNLDTEINRDYELHARVGSQKGYSVKYDGNGAAGTPPEDKTNYAEGSYADVKLPGDLAKADKVFLGWALKEDAQKADYQPGDKLLIKADMDVNGDGVITLYAVWGDKPVQTKLTYNANFGETPPTVEITLANNATVTILDYGNAELGLPPRSGYEFLGWSEDRNATETDKLYKAGDQIIVDETDTANENILYAIWKQSTVTLTVTKTVTGNFGDKSKAFQFSMQVDGGNSVELTAKGTALTQGKSDYTFSLKHGEFIEIKGIPVGKQIVLAETNADKYGVKFGENDMITSGPRAVTIASLTADTEIKVENYRDTPPDTGVFVDSLPYILIIACVAGVAALFLIRRRKKRED